MKKLNKRQKEHIKNVMIKALNITCYILSALFIILMCIVGLQSCKKDISGNYADDSYSQPYYYEEINSGSFAFQNGSRIELISQFDLDDNVGVFDTVEHKLVDGVYDIYDYNNSIWHYDKQIEYTFWYTYVGGSIDGNVWLPVYLNTSDNDIVLIELDNIQEPTFYYIQNDYGLKSYTNERRLNWFYTINLVDTFTFNKEYNYNAPVSNNLNNDYIDKYILMDGWQNEYISSYYRGKSLSLPYFISNGQVFNKILWVTEWSTSQGTGNEILYATSENDYYGIPDGKEVFSRLEYVNTNTNTSVIVNMRNTYTGYSSVFSLPYNAYVDGSTWINDAYRYLTILGNLTTQQQININAFNNNNQTSVSGFVGSGSVDNVFTLVASSFTAWLPVLSTYLLPGITIGMLLFIPLVAMLVFAIIRIIKK